MKPRPAPVAPDITESEWTVMEVLWKQSPLTALQVQKSLSAQTGWAVNTVRTLLTRLVEKGALVARKNDAGVAEFLPEVAREACVSLESQTFLQRVFRGAADSLLLHFVRNAKLTPEEIEMLKDEVDRAAAKQKK